MNILNDVSFVKKLDAGHVLESAELLASQLKQAWREARAIPVPPRFKKISSIVVSGMGGSALGAHIIQTLYADELRVPFTIVNGYHLPHSVNRQTLCIISSYSGSTEETVATLAEARRKGAVVFAISSGETIGRSIKRAEVPGYQFTPVFNPSGQPRMGLGYSLGAQLGLLSRLGLIKVSTTTIDEACALLGTLPRRWGLEQPVKQNRAKYMAEQLIHKVPVVVGAEFLAGNAHVFANQLHENAKTFTSYFVLPELNHHLLEGLKFPRELRSRLQFIFLTSRLYDPKNQARISVTKKVLVNQKISYVEFQPRSDSRIGQALETVAFSSHASFYLAAANRVNPANIPWVDYFKAELKKIR